MPQSEINLACSCLFNGAYESIDLSPCVVVLSKTLDISLRVIKTLVLCYSNKNAPSIIHIKAWTKKGFFSESGVCLLDVCPEETVEHNMNYNWVYLKVLII